MSVLAERGVRVVARCLEMRPLNVDRVDGLDRARISRQLRRWASIHGRTFEWRLRQDPYEVLVAEVLLQRTRADLVEAVYLRFIDQFPTSLALAEADPSAVAVVVEPLGLRKRQPLLPRLGRALVERHGGDVPEGMVDLLALPLVGRYVASAVRCLAFGRAEAMVDGGVVRVVRRLTGQSPSEARPSDDEYVHTAVRQLLGRRPREVNLGLVDLSALVCRRLPLCGACPVSGSCAFFNGAVDAS